VVIRKKACYIEGSKILNNTVEFSLRKCMIESKKYLITVIILSFLFLTSCGKKGGISLKAGSLALTLDNSGNVVGFEDAATGMDYHFKDTLAPILSIWSGEEKLMPRKATFTEGLLSLEFSTSIKAEIKVEEKESHLTLEVIALTGNENVDLVLWGPYPTTINGVIGETVGVVRNEDFALGIQSLNPKTLGGYPWNDNDEMPQIDIFESGDYSDLSRDGKRYVLYRVEAAKPTDFGSTLQAYTRNRHQDRVIENWGKEKYVAPALNDGGVIGSKIALFGSTEKATLETLGKIEVAEGLPHPTIDGQWGKTARSASAAYLIMGFSESTLDQAIDYTKRAGLKYLYHDGPFKNWGHFELNKSFPNGWAGLKTAVDKAEVNGLSVGVHTLSNFITTDDPWVTPIPDERLAKVGSSILSDDINTTQKEIAIESPDFFRQFKNNSLKTVQVGKELIRYGGVSDQAPWKLLDCQRGAYGTTVSNHNERDKISLLADHGYKVFLTSAELGDEMSENLAELYNETGLRQISFDGVEGNRSTGLGNYGEILFTTNWYNNLSNDIKSHLIIDASRTSHYFWHMYSRMNWGEPWYAGFRESQTEYRLKNQKYFQRNYMPGMLGWFSMRATTSIEDIEWMLARSAAFNAGYAFVAHLEPLEQNGFTDEILTAIGEWEKARMGNVFSEDQRKRMEAISNEFHLETVGENAWNLQQVYSHKFKHEHKIRQPGEPLYSTFEFDNTTGDNDVQFILTAEDADLSNIILELDNYKKVTLPVSLKDGQTLKYNGGGKGTVYNENWQKVSEINLEIAAFSILYGDHSITLDCTFSNLGKAPLAKLEVRLYGQVEPVRL
jgi:hypothetical protein